MKEIYVAGGCFWGVEAYFTQLKGVLKTDVGYANGNIENPTYQDLLNQKASHAETVHIIYDPKVLSLNSLLEHCFRFIDPFTLNRQGNDIGIQYRSGFYYTDVEDKPILRDYLQKIERETGKKVVAEIQPLKNYYLAETYHQNYLAKNPNGYCHVDLSLLKDEEKQ